MEIELVATHFEVLPDKVRATLIFLVDGYKVRYIRRDFETLEEAMVGIDDFMAELERQSAEYRRILSELN